MHHLFASGRAADIVLAAMGLEALWLIVIRRWQAKAVIGMLLPGALIVLGARAALVDAAWYWISLFFALSFPAHLFDLQRRHRADRGLTSPATTITKAR